MWVRSFEEFRADLDKVKIEAECNALKAEFLVGIMSKEEQMKIKIVQKGKDELGQVKRGIEWVGIKSEDGCFPAGLGRARMNSNLGPIEFWGQMTETGGNGVSRQLESKNANHFYKCYGNYDGGIAPIFQVRI